ncbi:PEP/pyruvate-binding domain-containing protein [Chondromyces apiculatus]|uniref:Phosphoenolpyruvate synthase n=1 Tax=Chondromyces apiculatus DSM 436 TaxID=1192034 RepID=A0A017SZN6_9BACT|nr:PEP/pyruvate-binding domain-containing protein [Chondromyces apiculatus]EYF01776.1 Phosphoenolpyruvate synthase [Chondromyces apiculatus DSM 436]
MMIHPLSELSRAHLSTAGGKGANLGELTRLGLSVPAGFVVSAEAYAEHARAWGLAERVAEHLASARWEAAAAEVAEIFARGALSPALEGAVREAYRALGAPKVAVRSSATAEDLAEASFAGQHDTFLDVEGEEAVLVALRRCWASLWTPRALRYRAARGIEHLGVDIAVVVQRMVPADFAGVLFTVDPVAQRADRMLLEVTPGLGEAVVSGQATGDVYRVRREPLAIEDRDRREADRPAPSEALVLALCRVGLQLEAHFGCPQDVEFAFAGDAVHLLQSRPITTLGAAEIEPLPPLPKLTRLQEKMSSGNDDRFPVAPKPLDQWGFRMFIPALLRTLRFLGAEVDAAEERAMLDQVWREMLVMPQPRPTLRLLGLPGKVAASLRRDWMGWWEGEAFGRIQEACAPVDLRALDDAALLGRADRIAAMTADVLGERFQGIVGMLASVALQVPVTAAVGKKRAAVLMADLFSGLHTRTSEVNLALHQLARRAASAGPEVSGAIREGRPEALADTEGGRAFLGEVEAFLDAHGHRETTGQYLSAPTWRQDPAPVWGLLRGLIDVTEPPSEEAGLARHQAALEEVTQALRFVPGLPGAFRRTLERLRERTVFRERSHYDLTRPISAMQAVIAEIARRLHERGHLPNPEDVFYLTEAEVRAWLGGEAPPRGEVEALVRRRRATYAVVNGRWQRRAHPPDAAGTSGSELRGVGASSGVVRGKARIVREEREFARLKPGEILVCPYTNPAWTSLFGIAAGLVTNVGGAASHGAIVAREYGIPAVLGAAGATERIVDGQEILVDGTEGRVKLLGQGGEVGGVSGVGGVGGVGGAARG